MFTIEQLDIETKASINNEVAKWLGADGQSAVRVNEKLAVESIELRYLELERDQETPITELGGDELHGPHAGLEAIVNIIENAATRDAMTRFGSCIYLLYFHLKNGRKNAGRFPFPVPGGAHQIKGNGMGGGGGSQALARRGGGGGGYMVGQMEMESATAAEALRVSVEMLRWSTEERRVNDDRGAQLFKNFEHVLGRQNEIIQGYMDREERILKLENDLNERKYELDLRKKSDEQKDEWMGKAIEIATTYGPMLLPPAVEALRKFSNGPNYVPDEGAIARKVAAVAEAARRAQAAEAADGAAPPQAGADGAKKTSGAPAAPAAAADGEPTELQQISIRVAFELIRLTALLKMTGADVTIRNALEGNEEIVQVFDAMLLAASAKDAKDRVDDLVQMSIGFGGALQANPLLAMQIVSAQDDFVKAALIEFSELLKHYVKHLQDVA